MTSRRITGDRCYSSSRLPPKSPFRVNKEHNPAGVFEDMRLGTRSNALWGSPKAKRRLT